jgi:hypothetical protein
MNPAPVTPTRESRQPSQLILDVEDDGIDPDTLEATAANIRLDDDVKARYLASLEAAEPTKPNGGATVESPLAAEHVQADTTDADADAQATGPVATPAHITKKNEHGKRFRNNCDLGRTPQGVVELEGGDNTPRYGRQPPVVKPPGSLGSSSAGFAPGEQKMRAIINADNVTVAQYAMAELGDYIAQLIAPIVAGQQAAEKKLDSVSEELRATHQKVVALEAKLEHQSIQQNRVAASIAHQQRQQPQQQHQQPQIQQQQQRQQQQQQQQQQPQRQQQGPRNPNPPFRPQRPELDQEEFPPLPPSEWKVRESRHEQQARKRQVREEKIAKEREAEKRERERREREREPRPRGPPLLVPKVKFPRAQRQIIVAFDPLKRPENMSDNAIATMALQLVNRAIVDRKDVRTPPFFSARITPNNNLVLVAPDHIKVIMYENYLGIIADALQRFGKATATLHEKWSKFLVRDVPAMMTHEDIREDIESKYPGLKLAQAPGWLVPRERREGRANATILLCLLGEVAIEQFGNRRLWIGNQSCKVDIYYEFAEYTQCPRCMGFGHPKQKCKETPRCAVCAGKHLTNDHKCQKEGCRQGPTCSHPPIECANCGANHKATDRGCTTRAKAYLAYRQRRGITEPMADEAAADEDRQ